MPDRVVSALPLPSGSGPLHAAAYGGHYDIVDMLISTGEDVNAVNSNRQTALHVSAQYGYIDIVRRLLDVGADKTIRDNNGYLPIDLAKYHARSHIVSGTIVNPPNGTIG